MLAGGHPNSLGRTIEVVDCVLRDPGRLDELFDCYGSDDETVRLRTSSAIKRILTEKPQWFRDCSRRIFSEMATLDQPSARWTIAQLFDQFGEAMSAEEVAAARDRLTLSRLEQMRSNSYW